MASEQLQEASTAEVTIPVSTMLEQDIMTVLANATSAINKEANMNNEHAPEGRPPTSYHTDTILATTEQTLTRLSEELDFARQEEKYWIATRQNIEHAMEALNTAHKVLVRDKTQVETNKVS